MYLVKFGFSVAIARTLSPEDYGLMGMIIIFISLGQMIMQSGLSMALIQKKDADSNDLSTAFWFNVMVAIAFYIILFFSAGAIARFYDKVLLVPVTRVAAVGIIINSLCSVQNSILTKKMEFRRLTWINLIGALVSGITGLVMALRGLAVWALVFQTLAGNMIYLIGLWVTSRWRPGMVFSIKSFTSLFSFGYKILLQGLTDVLITRLYFPLIGKIYSATQLGFYSNANRFDDLFIRKTTFAFNRVIFPAFSKLQDDSEKFSIGYNRSFKLIASVMSLASIIMIVAIRPFIDVALTSKWLPAAPYMQLFFAEGFIFPLLMFNHNILWAGGKSGESLRIDITNKALILLSMILLFRSGIMALIAGQLFATVISFLISMFCIIRIHKFKARDLLNHMLKLLLIAVICLLFSHFIINALSLSSWLELILKIFIIPLFFFTASLLLKMTIISELKTIIGDYRSPLSRV